MKVERARLMSELLNLEKTRNEELIQENSKIEEAIFKKNTDLMEL